MKKLITLVSVVVLSITIAKADDLNLNGFKLKPTGETSLFGVKKKGSDRGGDGIKGKIIIHAGIGLNLFKTNLDVRYRLSTAWDGAGTYPTIKQSPMINLGLDYGLGKKFSLGAAFGYQTATATLDDGYGDPLIDKWTRIHFAFRGDYHIIATDNVCLYTGLKVGYNIYKVTTNIPAPFADTYISELSKPSAISTQVHFGFSYFFASTVGINAEAGIGYGGPYILALGVTAKF